MNLNKLYKWALHTRMEKLSIKLEKLATEFFEKEMCVVYVDKKEFNQNVKMEVK